MHEEFERAYATLIQGTVEPYEGVMETPKRAAKAWADLTVGYGRDPAELFKTFDAESYDELVMLTNTPFYSLCEHHLLPFHGVAHIGYIAAGRIVGLSKLARLLDLYARRLQVQERLTREIADAIEDNLKPAGIIVIVQAEHLCMAMRGTMKPGVTTTTSVVRGAMKENPGARAEAMALIT